MLRNVCIVVIGLSVATSLCLFPAYTGAAFPKKATKSLRLKMTLSTMFMIIAVASAVMAKNTSTFAVLMLVGFAFSWLGDLLLGKGDSTKLFLSGMSSFFVTHIFYIAAITVAARHFFPDSPLVVPSGLAAGITVGFLEILLCVTRKARFHGLLVPTSVYATFLIIMFAQAFSLGLRLFPENRAAILLPSGAFFFLLSDTTLGMLRFRMHKKVFSFRTVCSVSYFVGQMLIAMSLAAIVC